jgi:hypothetical protein
MYYYNDVQDNLTSDSVINISAPETITPGYPMPEQHFVNWNLTGTASIDNANSRSTNIRNINSDVTVSTYYSE